MSDPTQWQQTTAETLVRISAEMPKSSGVLVKMNEHTLRMVSLFYPQIFDPEVRRVSAPGDIALRGWLWGVGVVFDAEVADFDFKFVERS
jgi:hypothetical protein